MGRWRWSGDAYGCQKRIWEHWWWNPGRNKIFLGITYMQYLDSEKTKQSKPPQGQFRKPVKILVLSLVALELIWCFLIGFLSVVVAIIMNPFHRLRMIR